MRCSLLGASGAVVALLAALVGALPAKAGDRTLPMRFELRRQGPAESCGIACKTYIAASGAITADSARDFIRAVQGRDLSDAILVLDSDGGSVLGAIALGREVRKLRLAATVGRVVDLKGDVVGRAAAIDIAKDNAKDTAKDNAERNADIAAVVSPRADCESMCAFVLLGGVQRTVPPEARVMVHQIWLGDRRDDPTAATYSAEDLVLVQRDIGRLAQFTAEMGASIDLLDSAMGAAAYDDAQRTSPHPARHRRCGCAACRRRRSGAAGSGFAGRAGDQRLARDADQRAALGDGRSRRHCLAGAAAPVHD